MNEAVAAMQKSVESAVIGKSITSFSPIDGFGFEFGLDDGSKLTLLANGQARLTKDVELSPPCRPFAAVPVKVEMVDTPESLAGIKPPSTRITIDKGFDLNLFGMGAMPVSQYDWGRIISQPPFQEYVQSRHRAFNADDPVESCIGFLSGLAKSGQSESEVYGEYASWFESANRWPSENPDGTLKAV